MRGLHFAIVDEADSVVIDAAPRLLVAPIELLGGGQKNPRGDELRHRRNRFLQ